jgi:hypothetical protein
MFSCFACPNSFSAVLRALGPAFLFSLQDKYSAVRRALGPVFMFGGPGLIFDGSKGVGSSFHVLRLALVFDGTEGVRSCFDVLHSRTFSAVRTASGPILKFCAPVLIFGGINGVVSCFHVLRSRTRFPWYRGRQILFSCFALPDSFSVVSKVSGPVFMFCVHVLVFGGTEGVSSHFYDLRSRNRFPWYRGRRVPFSCFARPYSFTAVPRASGLVFMFCTPRLIFGGIEGVDSRFHVLRVQTRFRRYRGRRVPFSYFALSDTFSAVPMTSVPIIIFCAPGHVFDGVEDVGSRFNVSSSRTHFRWFRAHQVPF